MTPEESAADAATMLAELDRVDVEISQLADVLTGQAEPSPHCPSCTCFSTGIGIVQARATAIELYELVKASIETMRTWREAGATDADVQAVRTRALAVAKRLRTDVFETERLDLG